MKWENQLPASAFGEGYWPKIRAGDNIETAFWLYNRTGESWLLDLAAKIHQGMARWDTDVINWHNVNVAQGFRAGTVFWMQSKDPGHLESAERNYQKVTDLYGQFPGGDFVADENAGPATQTRGAALRPAVSWSSCTVSRCSPGSPAIRSGPTAARSSPSTACLPR